jgi:hypothetical protein
MRANICDASPLKLLELFGQFPRHADRPLPAQDFFQVLERPPQPMWRFERDECGGLAPNLTQQSAARLRLARQKPQVKKSAGGESGRDQGRQDRARPWHRRDPVSARKCAAHKNFAGIIDTRGARLGNQCDVASIQRVQEPGNLGRPAEFKKRGYRRFDVVV